MKKNLEQVVLKLHGISKTRVLDTWYFTSDFEKNFLHQQPLWGQNQIGWCAIVFLLKKNNHTLMMMII